MMSAPLAKDHIVFMPQTMTYAGSPVQGVAAKTGFAARLRNAVRYVVEMPRRQAVMTELSRLSDRELADIGLSRSEIGHVFARSR